MSRESMTAAWRSFTATTFDQAFNLIYSDRDRLIAAIYRFNSFQKWNTRPDHFDDYRSDLCLHLVEKWRDQEAFVQWFNTPYFRFWLTQYTRHKMHSNDGHHRKYGERNTSLDDADLRINAPHHDQVFELDDPVRCLRLSDPDVILFLLDTKHFSDFTAAQKAIYLRWFDATRDAQKRISIAEVARQTKKPEKTCRKAIIGINRIMRERIQYINSL